MPEPRDQSSVRVVVAVHSREVKTSLFLALNGIDDVAIVATANSTAELVSYTRALTPTFVLVETGLPGRPIGEVIEKLREVAPESRVMVVEGAGEGAALGASSNVEVFRDVDQLVTPLPETGLDL
mgnify:CR=1 FL=1